MRLLSNHVVHRLSLSVIALFLVVFLAACGGLGSGTSGTPTPNATPSPTPSPTPAVVTYTGSGYTIDYPKDWTKSTTTAETSFQDSLGVNALGVVVVANPNGIAQPSAAVDATLVSSAKELNMTNTSPANVPASTSLAGATWVQKGSVGTVSKSGASVSVEIVVLATNHPANAPTTQVFEIVYAGPLVSSTLLDAQTFQAMLTSFKFTS